MLSSIFPANEQSSRSQIDRPSEPNSSGKCLLSNIPYRPSCKGEEDSPDVLNALYKPLERGSFRLLYLQDRLEDGVLQCSFQHADFPEHGSELPFVAVSYTWSSSDLFWYGKYNTSPKPVILDGRKVMIADKVANILNLMQQTKRRVVWIDAMCINQRNNAEKAVQVPRMDLIYGLASEVCVVLGSPHPRIDHFLDSVEGGITTGIVSKYIRELTRAERKTWRKTIGWRGFDKLARNIYWRRAWVLQELMLGDKITLFSGTRTVDFAKLCDFVGQLRQIFDYRISKNDLESFFALVVRFHNKGSLTWVAWAKSTTDHLPNQQLPKIPILELLRVTRGWNQCRDPRDMLYSKLAMATDAREIIQNPDYDLSLSSVFRDFATAHIRFHGTLETIAFATPTRASLDLPSWVPDWTSTSKDWRPLTCSKIPYLVYPEIPYPPRFSDDGSEIIVRGKVVGRVASSLLRNLERLIDNSGSATAAFGVPVRELWLNPDEVPRNGDLICLLQSFSTFAYLRPQGECYRLVGRHELCQNWIQGGKFEFYGLLAWRGLHRDALYYKSVSEEMDPQVLERALSCAEVEFRIQ